MRCFSGDLTYEDFSKKATKAIRNGAGFVFCDILESKYLYRYKNGNGKLASVRYDDLVRSENTIFALDFDNLFRMLYGVVY